MTSGRDHRCRGDRRRAADHEGRVRRFVDRQPHPPALVGAVRLAKLSEHAGGLTTMAAAGITDLPLVSTPIIRKVISTSRLLVQLNRNQVSARVVMVGGGIRMGVLATGEEGCSRLVMAVLSG